MKLSSYAVNQVYSLLGSVTAKKYLYCKPTNANDEQYIVINSLPVNGGVIQTCHVNVNCHVKDMAPGIPYLEKLEELATSVLDILKKVTTTSVLIDFESQETIRDENLGEHYENLRFFVRIRNI